MSQDAICLTTFDWYLAKYDSSLKIGVMVGCTVICGDNGGNNEAVKVAYWY